MLYCMCRFLQGKECGASSSVNVAVANFKQEHEGQCCNVARSCISLEEAADSGAMSYHSFDKVAGNVVSNYRSLEKVDMAGSVAVSCCSCEEMADEDGSEENCNLEELDVEKVAGNVVSNYGSLEKVAMAGSVMRCSSDEMTNGEDFEESYNSEELDGENVSSNIALRYQEVAGSIAESFDSLEENEGFEESYPTVFDSRILTYMQLKKHIDTVVAGIVVAGGPGAAARLDLSSSQPILLNKTATPPLGRSASSSGFSSYSTASPTALAESKQVSFTNLERNPPDSGNISVVSKEGTAGQITALEKDITPDLSTIDEIDVSHYNFVS